MNLRRILWKLADITAPLWHSRLPDNIEHLTQTFRSEINRCTAGLANADWSEFVTRIVQESNAGRPANFLRWPTIQETMFVTRPPYLETELAYLRGHSLWRSVWSAAMQETRVGNPLPYWKMPRTSGSSIHHAYHLCRWHDFSRTKIEDIQSIFEFGGGYGNLCRLSRRAGFNGPYVIFDLPALGALQRFYLAATQTPGDNALISTLADGIKAIETARENEAMFIATWSFSEVTLCVRTIFEPHLKQFKHILLTFQDKFAGVDNVAYFHDLSLRLSGSHACSIQPIDHIPGNSYFFAKLR